MADTICRYQVSIESPLLIEILKRYGELPNNDYDGYVGMYGCDFLFVTDGVFHFSFDEGYGGIEKPIKTLNDFMNAFLSAIEIDFPPEDLEPFVEAQEEIYKRADEIKDDIIKAECSYSIEAMYPDDDTGVLIYEAMSDADAKKFNKSEDERISGYHFSTNYSYNRGKEKSDYSYDFDFQ